MASVWSFFSRDPASSFNYEIGERLTGIEDVSLWGLHDGKKKNSGDEVSVFVFDAKGKTDAQIQVAKGAFKRTKTLRHPNMLMFLDGLETDKVLYVVTERVSPLSEHLRRSESVDATTLGAISWGLHQIAKGLSFLINDCQLIHNNVCMSSIFVDKAGEWKLGGVDFMFSAQGTDSTPPIKILPALEKYDPPEKAQGFGAGGAGRRKSENWSVDMWGLGCLIWEAFNGYLVKPNSLKVVNKLPKSLTASYVQLVGANPRSRPNPSTFITECRTRGNFMDNKFVDTMLFLEEIQIKDAHEKTQFFTSLTPALDTFPPSFCRYKILPQILNAFEFSNAGSAVLAPLFKIGKLLETSEYQKKILPCVVKMFASTDRSTRVSLLQQIEHFIDHVDTGTVNTQIFPNVVHGFSDTNPVVREASIKSMLHLSAKLNNKNLNEELMKHFARLQTKDEQGGIRTNTTICLGKIACHLNPQIRQKVLPSAFTRALRDPFPAARSAAISSMGSTRHYLPMKDVATRLLPAICPMTADPERSVRDQAFKTISEFIKTLMTLSDNPDSVTELEKDLMSTSSQQQAGWTGWALTGMSALSSKFSKTGVAGPQQQAGADPTGQQSKAPSISGTSAAEVRPSNTSAQGLSHGRDAPTETGGHRTGVERGDNGGDGWDDDDWGDMEDMKDAEDGGSEDGGSKEGDGWGDTDDWGALEDEGEQPVKTSYSHPSAAVKEKEGWSGRWGVEEEDFAPIEEAHGVTKASAYNWGGEADGGDDFFSSVAKPAGSKKSTKTNAPSPRRALGSRPAASANRAPAAATPAAQSSSANDNSWGDDGWEVEPVQNKPTAQQRKEEREEKRLQRQMEMADRKVQQKPRSGGALKLGAKKANID